jgi:hypothetical protein
MEMLPPAPVPPNVVVGATVVKRFPGYGERRGTIAEIDLDGGKVVVRWPSDERTTLSLGEAAKRALYAVPQTEEEEDGDSTIAYDSGDETADYEGDGELTTTSSRFWGVTWDRRSKKWQARYKDANGKRHSIGLFDDEEEAARAVNKAIRDAGLEGRRKTNAVDATGALVPKPQKTAAVPPDPARAPTETSSRFWGVTWDRGRKKWQARYKDANGKCRSIGYFDDEEEAARAHDKAIRDAGLEGKRRVNAIDATGALVPREFTIRCDRSAVVAPDPTRAASATTSKYWGVTWDKRERRWKAKYTDASGKRRSIGRFDTQESAAHAVNAAIRRAGLEGRRKTNPVVDGQLVPRKTNKRGVKRRRDEPAAAPSPRARRR